MLHHSTPGPLPGLSAVLFQFLASLRARPSTRASSTVLAALPWQEIKTHPRQQDWLLAKVRRDECMLDRRSQACAYDLFLSQVGALGAAGARGWALQLGPRWVGGSSLVLENVDRECAALSGCWWLCRPAP